MNMRLQQLFLIISLILCTLQAQTSQIPVPFSNWVATDGLGRTVPQAHEAGVPKPDKYVGVFYYIWQGHHNATAVYDITKLLKNNPNDPAYGPLSFFHWWGEPEAGYYRANDPWVVRRNLQMLSVAGVDFLYFDVTNSFTYLYVVDTLCRISTLMRQDGIQTPHITFCTNSSSGKTMNELYDLFYSKNKYKDLWFYWEGKPLILGNPNDAVLRPEVKQFFTIKYSWAWTDAVNNPNHWQWIDTYPQNWGWSSDPKKADQLPVAKASHPTNNCGDSYQNKTQPAFDQYKLTPYTGQGRHSAEQWGRVFEVNPRVVMITQWNEWVAQRFEGTSTNRPDFLGHQVAVGETYFVDLYTQEYNRDIEPMKGGHTDNHYYQMLGNIRKFKGMAPVIPASPDPKIIIDGSFADWTQVQPVFQDCKGDVAHRNFIKYDGNTVYTNNTGRNDIVESRAAAGGAGICFYVKTNSALTAHTGANWMLLFINSDRKKSTGWEGFDYAANLERTSDSKSSLHTWNNTGWTKIADIDYRYSGNQMELSIPRGLIGMTQPEVAFYFQWADNIASLNEISEFFINGDAAPDRRFTYSFIDTVVMTSIGQQANVRNEGRFLHIKMQTNRLIVPVLSNVPSLRKRATLSVCSATGRIITTRSITLGKEIDLSKVQFSNGYYIVEIRSEGHLLGRSGFIYSRK